MLLQINFFTLLATTKARLTEVMMTKRMISTLKKMMLKLLQLFKILGYGTLGERVGIWVRASGLGLESGVEN